ncbi:hypothetical protein ACOMHN_023177 [Nucella lapillus]
MEFQSSARTSGLSLNTSLSTMHTITITTIDNNNININNKSDEDWAEATLTQTDDGLISDQTLNAFMAVFKLMMPVLCLLAVTFCVFNAAVYWQQRAAHFALYLVAVDLGDGLCSLVELLHSLIYFSLPVDNYGHLVVKWYLAKYVAASCRRAAVCLNAFATLERFLAIAFPLKSFSRRVCARPGIIIIAVFVTSLIAHVYFAVEYEVARTSAGSWSLMHTSIRKQHPEAFVLWSLVDSIIFAYSPLVAIVVLNTTLVIVLRMHASSLNVVRRDRGKKTSQYTHQDDSGLISGCGDSNGSKNLQNKVVADDDMKKKKTEKENQTTKMVIVFSTVVFVMALPRMLNSSARSILSDYGPKGKEKNVYNAIGLLSQITSHFTETALFWVAVAYSRSFRRSVLRLPVTRWLFGRWLGKTSSLPATSSSDVSSSTRGSSYLPR